MLTSVVVKISDVPFFGSRIPDYALPAQGINNPGQTLGVRDNEIEIDPNTGRAIPGNEFDPNTGLADKGKGMSVAPDNPANLPERHRPNWLPGGRSPHPLWQIRESQLPDGLQYKPDSGDSPTHGVIQPAYPMTVEKFKLLIERTQPSWERIQ
jgi:hypothetical protein